MPNELNLQKISTRVFKELIEDNFKFLNMNGLEALKQFKEIAQNDLKLKHIIRLYLKMQGKDSEEAKCFDPFVIPRFKQIVEFQSRYEKFAETQQKYGSRQEWFGNNSDQINPQLLEVLSSRARYFI